MYFIAISSISFFHIFLFLFSNDIWSNVKFLLEIFNRFSIFYFILAIGIFSYRSLAYPLKKMFFMFLSNSLAIYFSNANDSVLLEVLL